MGFYEQFPYTNFHEMNLNWIISEIKNIPDKIESALESNTDIQNIIAELLKNKTMIRVYDTFIDLIGDAKNVMPESVVFCKGYYNTTDNTNALYVIKSKSKDRVNEIDLGYGKCAVCARDEYDIDVSWLGAVPSRYDNKIAESENALYKIFEEIKVPFEKYKNGVRRSYTLKFPSGLYYINKPVHILGRTTIEGAGANSQISSKFNTNTIFIMNGAESKLLISGYDESGNPVQGGLVNKDSETYFRAESVSIKNITMISESSYNVAIAGFLCPLMTVENVTIMSSKVGMYLDCSWLSRFDNVIINSECYNIVLAQSSAGTTINHCLLTARQLQNTEQIKNLYDLNKMMPSAENNYYSSNILLYKLNEVSINHTSPENSIFCVVSNGCEKVSINNCDFEKFKGGVYAVNSKNISVNDCSCWNPVAKTGSLVYAIGSFVECKGCYVTPQEVCLHNENSHVIVDKCTVGTDIDFSNVTTLQGSLGRKITFAKMLGGGLTFTITNGGAIVERQYFGNVTDPVVPESFSWKPKNIPSFIITKPSGESKVIYLEDKGEGIKFYQAGVTEALTSASFSGYNSIVSLNEFSINRCLTD